MSRRNTIQGRNLTILNRRSTYFRIIEKETNAIPYYHIFILLFWLTCTVPHTFLRKLYLYEVTSANILQSCDKLLRELASIPCYQQHLHFDLF